MSKGSAQRPKQITDKKLSDNWERIFGQPKGTKKDGKSRQTDKVQ